MNRIGIVLLVIGLCGLGYSITLDTTVAGKHYVETDQYGIAQVVRPGDVHNIGLMNQKQNLLILFGALAIVGAVMSVAGRRSER